MFAHNILYTFIASYLISVDLNKIINFVLLVFGLFSILGIWIIGIFIDRALRKLVLMSLISFAVAAILMGLFSGHTLIVIKNGFKSGSRLSLE